MDDRRNDLPPPPPPGGTGPADGGYPSVWAPPDAAASYERMGRDEVPPSHLDVEVEPDAPGPPPPPFVRQRRRRRRNLLIAVAVVAVIGIPVGLAVAGGLTTTDGQEAAEGDAGDTAPEGRDDGGDTAPDDRNGDDGSAGTSPRDIEVEPPDLDRLEGIDAVYGRLLTDIDASERTMMAFQDDVRAVLQGQVPDPDGAISALSSAAEERRADLLEIRERLADGLTDEGAEAVRESYVVHLDSWADYMAAIGDDPEILAQEDGTGSYTVHINATAETFARTLEERLPEDVDDEVQAFAEGLLDRGFRGGGDADV